MGVCANDDFASLLPAVCVCHCWQPTQWWFVSCSSVWLAAQRHMSRVCVAGHWCARTTARQDILHGVEPSHWHGLVSPVCCFHCPLMNPVSSVLSQLDVFSPAVCLPAVCIHSRFEGSVCTNYIAGVAPFTPIAGVLCLFHYWFGVKVSWPHSSRSR